MCDISVWCTFRASPQAIKRDDTHLSETNHLFLNILQPRYSGKMAYVCYSKYLFEKIWNRINLWYLCPSKVSIIKDSFRLHSYELPVGFERENMKGDSWILQSKFQGSKVLTHSLRLFESSSKCFFFYHWRIFAIIKNWIAG